MKKFSLLSLLIIASMILAACGSTAPETTQAPVVEEPVVEEPVDKGSCPLAVEDGAVITFSGWGDESEQKVYRDSIERFKSVCPGVTVNYTPVPADFQTKMKAQMAGGTAPDVFYVDDQLMTAFAPSEQIMPLDDLMAEAGVSTDDFLASLMPIYQLNGKTYALPKDWGTLGLIYIPKAFADAGIDEPTADWTWDDVRAAANTIAEKGNYGGFCMGNDWARFLPIALSYGGSYATADYTTATLDTPEVLEAANLVADMFEEGSLVRPVDLSTGWCGEAIGLEAVAMTTEGGWMVNTMKNTYPDVEWKAVEIPAGPVKKADVIFVNGIGVNAATPYPKAAAAFLFYVTGFDNQAEIVKTGFAYSTHPSQADLIVDENDKAIAQGGLLPDSVVAFWGPNTGKVNDAVSQALERIFLGDQTVEEAFAQAQTEAQTVLSE
ncbi:MAG: sugar ABC transporter substrate-binding protein [Anaerolineaceae bacterium]|mgnify:FL=1|nr:sugar ABC transporter substrate-binding protein [Anaerolineaceae bacterium]MDD4042429.1 sugar ABC transporter substrate-binding protein [Anaerolineaceae bacterium]